MVWCLWCLNEHTSIALEEPPLHDDLTGVGTLRTEVGRKVPYAHNFSLGSRKRFLPKDCLAAAMTFQHARMHKGF
eukprot:612287-Amphidinium_carterae.1